MNVKENIPLSKSAKESVQKGRTQIQNILDRSDHRLMAVVGPCSIHDIDVAKEYAAKLYELSEKVKDTILIVMRVYFEKPRTTTGWKGFLNDPYINDTFKIQEGIEKGRQLLIDLATLGLPLGTEALDPISPQYLQDTISWTAIGARTSESQTHREMASGLSTPIGHKNSTDGNVQTAINAIKSASEGHRFLGINQEGKVSIVHTKGNKYGHIVLRGGNGKPNYDSVNVNLCEELLRKSDMVPNIMIDCSHANSNKDHNLQPLILKDTITQIKEGNNSIIGLMLESNLFSGKQSIPQNLNDLKYGVSITDGCIDWNTTEETLSELRNELKNILPQRLST